MNHYTDRQGYNSIRAQPIWLFFALQPPPEDHPVGAYFTSLPRDTPKLAKKLLISRDKVKYVFTFVDVGDLKPLRGGRGNFIFYSPEDYPVAEDRQQFHGETGL